MRVDYVCETCGKTGHRSYAKGKISSHFFCSRECQNEWQKTRQDIVEKNKDPEFRRKVSRGLKERKKRLGENYHSPETKKKIGAATVEHWNSYDEKTKKHMLKVLNHNAQARRTYGPYDCDWHHLSQAMTSHGVCHRCGSRERLIVHHIIPVKAGGNRNSKNLVVLCRNCHTTVEYQERKIFEIIPDWNIVQLLVRERLHCI